MWSAYPAASMMSLHAQSGRTHGDGPDWIGHHWPLPVAATTTEVRVSFQSLIWFGVAGGSLVAAAALLHARYVRHDPRHVNAGNGTLLFAICLVLFAVGAAIAGFVSLPAQVNVN